MNPIRDTEQLRSDTMRYITDCSDKYFLEVLVVQHMSEFQVKHQQPRLSGQKAGSPLKLEFHYVFLW